GLQTCALPISSKAEEVARQLRDYLDTVQRQPKITPTVEAFGRHLDLVSRRYWPGLFHCYDVPGLPRTNNELESHFRETRRRLLRTTGQQGQTQRTLQRQGAWELLPHPPTEAKLPETLRQIPPENREQECSLGYDSGCGSGGVEGLGAGGSGRARPRVPATSLTGLPLRPGRAHSAPDGRAIQAAPLETARHTRGDCNG